MSNEAKPEKPKRKPTEEERRLFKEAEILLAKLGAAIEELEVNAEKNAKKH